MANPPEVGVFPPLAPEKLPTAPQVPNFPPLDNNNNVQGDKQNGKEEENEKDDTQSPGFAKPEPPAEQQSDKPWWEW